MLSRLNLYQSNNKKNFRFKSAQKISNTYTNLNIFNLNYKSNNNRFHSNLKSKKEKMPIKNNRYNLQLNIFCYPYGASNNYLDKSMRGITPKKINIKNDKKSIDIYRSSNNQNRNKIEILKIYKNLYFPKEEEYKGINKEETKVNLLIKNEINKNVQVKNAVISLHFSL